MSVVGAIIVYRCSFCPEVKVVNTERGLDDFGTEWFFGINLDLCGGCRGKVEHQAMIQTDETLMAESSARIAGAVAQKIQEVTNVH